MSSVDERVVEMKFNNQQFERGASQTIGTLDRLKGALHFPSGAGSVLQNIQSAIGPLASRGLGGLVSGVEAVGRKFSGLGVMGVTALATITSQAVFAGEQLVKSLTISPIRAGFNEYETEMKSIQTILANTAKYGTKLPDVTKALNQLNNYADKTIYSFSDMTSNIGLFTNAGLRLETSVSMIKGFSNAAAASGTNAEGAAHAAYQLSQALSAGTIRLMDWRSLTNVGMGNSNMRRGLVDIAEAMGTIESHGTSATKINKDFNSSLEKGWLSADVMSKYLGIMAGDIDATKMKTLGLTDAQIKLFLSEQKTAEEAATKVRTWSQLVGTLQEAVGTTWADTFRILLGNFNEATGLFTDMSNTIGGLILASGKARNKMLGDWKALGGRTVLINAITYAWEALVAVVKPIRYAFREIFPATTGKQLMAITRALEYFTATLMPQQTTLDKIYRTARGFFAALDIGRMIIWEVVKLLVRLLGGLGGSSVGILEITANIGDWIVALRNAIKDGKGLTTFFTTLGDVLLIPINLLRSFIGVIAAFATGISGGNFDDFTNRLGKMGKRLFSLNEGGARLKLFFSNIGTFISGISPGLAPAIKTIEKVAGQIGTALGDGFKNVKYSDILDTINTSLFGGLLLILKKFSIFGGKGSEGGGFLSSLTEAIHGVTDTLKALQENIKSKTLITIAIALAILTASIIALSLIDSEKLGNALKAMTIMYVQLGIFTKVMTGMLDVKGLAKMPLLAAGMILFGIAIGVLAASVKMLAGLKPEELARGLIGIVVIMGSVVGFVKLIGPSMQKKMFAAALGLRVVAVSIEALAKTAALLGKQDWPSLIRGLTGITVLLGALAGYTRLVNPKKMITVGIAMNIMALAVAQLAKAIVPLAKLDLVQLAQGLTGMVVILASIAGFTRLVDPKQMMATGIALLAVGFGMHELASAIKVLSTIPMDKSGLALGIMAGALVLLARAMKMMPPGMLLISVGLYVVAQAMKVLAQSVQMMAAIPMEGLLSGIGGLGAVMLILAAGLRLMEGTMKGSVAMILAAAALTILVPSIVTLSGLDTMSVVNALIALAGAIVILAAGMVLMQSGLAGAAALIVAATAIAILVPPLMALASMDLLALITGLGALAVALGLLIAAGMLITPAIPGLLGLGAALALIGIGVGLAAVGIGALLVGLAALVGSLAALAAVGPQVGTNLTAALTAILNLIPLFIRKIGEGVVEFAKQIQKGAPAIVRAISAIFMSMLTQMTHDIPKIVAKIAVMVVKILDTLSKSVPKMVASGMRLLAGILKGIADHIGQVADQATRVIQKFMDAIGRNGPKLADSGAKMIIKFVNGLADSIRKRAPEMNRAGLNLAKAIVSGMTDGLHVALDALIGAARNMASGVIDTVKAILGIHSPSTEFRKIGENVNEGFLEGLLGTRDQVYSAFDDMQGKLTDFIRNSAQDIEDYKKKVSDAQVKVKTDDTDIARQQIRVSDARAAKKANTATKTAQKRVDSLRLTRQKDTYAITQNRKALARAKKAEGDYTDVKTAEHRLAVARNKKHPDQFAVWLAEKNLAKVRAKHKDSQKVADAEHKLSESQAKKQRDDAAYNEAIRARDAARSKNNRGQALKDAQAQLTKMQNARKKDADAVTAAQKEQADATAENLKAQAALEELNKQIADNEEAQAVLSDQLKTANDNLDEHTRLLEEATKARDDYTNSIKEQYAALADVTADDPTTEEQITLEQYMKNMQKQTDDTIGFTKQLDTLRARGLDDTLYEKFLSQGTEAMPFMGMLLDSGQEGINQINTLDSRLRSAAETLGLHGAKELKQAAVDTEQGYVNGFTNDVKSFEDQMAVLADAMVTALKKKLEIESPSRVFARLGGYSADGLAKGIDQSAGVVTTAAAGLGDEAVSALKGTMSQISSAVSDNIDINPTIRPVLDLTDIQAGAGTIGGMLGNPGIGVNGTYGQAAYASNGYLANQDAYLSYGRNAPAPIAFTQNNYSPKSLSASEIYRQTKNQISIAKGATSR